jgi:hypothetical protein
MRCRRKKVSIALCQKERSNVDAQRGAVIDVGEQDLKQ